MSTDARRTGSHHFGHSQTPLTQTCESCFPHIRIHPYTSVYMAGSLRMHSSCGFRRSPGVPGPGRGPPGIVLQGPSGNDEMMESCPPCVSSPVHDAPEGPSAPSPAPGSAAARPRRGGQPPVAQGRNVHFPGIRIPRDPRDTYPWKVNIPALGYGTHRTGGRHPAPHPGPRIWRSPPLPGRGSVRCRTRELFVFQGHGSRPSAGTRVPGKRRIPVFCNGPSRASCVRTDGHRTGPASRVAN